MLGSIREIQFQKPPILRFRFGIPNNPTFVSSFRKSESGVFFHFQLKEAGNS